MSDFVSEALALAGVFIGLVSAVVVILRNRIDGIKTLVDAAATLVAPLRDRIVELETRVDVLESRLRFQDEIILRAREEHLSRVGAEPNWYLRYSRRPRS